MGPYMRFVHVQHFFLMYAAPPTWMGVVRCMIGLRAILINGDNSLACAVVIANNVSHLHRIFCCYALTYRRFRRLVLANCIGFLVSFSIAAIGAVCMLPVVGTILMQKQFYGTLPLSVLVLGGL